MSSRDPETGQFVAGNGGSIDLDPDDLFHQHVQTNIKAISGEGGTNDQYAIEGDPIHEPLDGGLARGDVAMLVAVTNYGLSANLASGGTTPSQLNIAHELSLDPIPAIATRDRREAERDKTADYSEDGTITVDVIERDELGAPILFADRLDALYQNWYETGGPQQYIDVVHEYGGALPFFPDDLVYQHWLFNEDGCDYNYSIRSQFTLHWYVFEGELPEYPEFTR